MRKRAKIIQVILIIALNVDFFKKYLSISSGV